MNVSPRLRASLRLPPELLLSIVKYSDYMCYHDATKAARLVCRAWSELFLSPLFQETTIRLKQPYTASASSTYSSDDSSSGDEVEERHDLLALCIFLEEHPAVSACVRILELADMDARVQDSSRTSVTKYRAFLDPTLLRRALSRLLSLEELLLVDIYPCKPFVPADHTILASSPLHIKQLSIPFPGKCHEPAQGEVLSNILSIFDGITFTFFLKDGPLEMRYEFPPEHSLSSSEELLISSSRYQIPRVACSWDALPALIVDHSAFSAISHAYTTLGYDTSNHANSLLSNNHQSLTNIIFEILVDPEWIDASNPPDLSNCTSLEELVIVLTHPGGTWIRKENSPEIFKYLSNILLSLRRRSSVTPLHRLLLQIMPCEHCYTTEDWPLTLDFLRSLDKILDELIEAGVCNSVDILMDSMRWDEIASVDTLLRRQQGENGRMPTAQELEESCVAYIKQNLERVSKRNALRFGFGTCQLFSSMSLTHWDVWERWIPSDVKWC